MHISTHLPVGAHHFSVSKDRCEAATGICLGVGVRASFTTVLFLRLGTVVKLLSEVDDKEDGEDSSGKAAPRRSGVGGMLGASGECAPGPPLQQPRAVCQAAKPRCCSTLQAIALRHMRNRCAPEQQQDCRQAMPCLAGLLEA